MDEYVGLPESHPQSFHTFMRDTFFSKIDILPGNVHILNGNATDIEAEIDDGLAAALLVESRLRVGEILALNHRIAPAVLNGLGADPDSAAPVVWETQDCPYDVLVSNSFAFGGLNAVLIAKKV